MRNEYEMVTVADYISGLNNVKCVSIEEKERQNKEFDDQFKRISQFGEVDSN